MNPLHLIRARLRMPALLRFARDAGVDARDPGYLVHLLLRRVFGEIAPQPFHLEESRSAPLLWGYAAVDATILQERLAFADPLAAAAIDPQTLASRPMPVHFAPGRRLGFRLRACPVVRSRRLRGDGRPVEVDVFLARALVAPGEPVDREAVYRDWLAARLGDRGARVERVRLVRFLQGPLVRRTGGGRPHPLRSPAGGLGRRPDVTFEGVLEVVEPGAFARALARGVGRHRAFGHGMLLLRPPE